MSEKYRKAFYRIIKVLNSGDHDVAALMGLRRMGKSTILRQLADCYNTVPVDFRNEMFPEAAFYNAMDNGAPVIFLDEIGYLPDFDMLFDGIDKKVREKGKKVVLSSSSYIALRQLTLERLGCRSHRIELFPLDFEEYLYFSDKISKYGEQYTPTPEDLQNFYRLKDLPDGMDFILDERYLEETITDIDIARKHQQYAARGVFPTRAQHASVLDILAYTLGAKVPLRRFGNTRLGHQEFGDNARGMRFADTLIGVSNNITGKMRAADIAFTLAYMLHAGFTFIDLEINEESAQEPDRVESNLLAVRTEEDLEAILRQYTISVISPLIYTRLLVNLERWVDTVAGNPGLYGDLFELTAKSEDVYKRDYVTLHSSYKYQDAKYGEVDLFSQGILLMECAVGPKKEWKPGQPRKRDEYSVHLAFPERNLVRVVTCEAGVPEEKRGAYYKIAHPEALLELSNGILYRLEQKPGLSASANAGSTVYTLPELSADLYTDM